MRRFNFFIEQEWIDKARSEMNKHGFRTVASFFRFIIIKFFDEKINSGKK